jgi:hypothetical protein
LAFGADQAFSSLLEGLHELLFLLALLFGQRLLLFRDDPVALELDPHIDQVPISQILNDPLADPDRLKIPTLTLAMLKHQMQGRPQSQLHRRTASQQSSHNPIGNQQLSLAVRSLDCFQHAVEESIVE